MKISFKAMTCAFALVLTSAAIAQAEGTVVDAFVGKKIVSERGTVFEYRADGTIGGLLGGKMEIEGKYLADGEKSCTLYSAPEPLLHGVSCSIPRIEGNSVIFLRDDGSESAPYVIQ